MAKGKKTGGKNFAPGNKLGKGAGHHNADLKKIRKLTHEQVAEMGSVLLDGTDGALLAIQENPESSTLKKWIASIITIGIERGDSRALDVLLDRLIGKVKEEIEVTGVDYRVNLTMPSNGREAPTGNPKGEPTE
jgi:hypothetical protein